MTPTSTIEDLAAHCIRCGFCLESCPTFQITGIETESPRGRIQLIQSADRDELPWSEIRTAVDHCVGCRACETACPSGVEYGSLLELARQKLRPSLATKTILSMVTSPIGQRTMRLAAGRKLPGAEAQIPIPQKEKAWPKLEATGSRGQVLLLDGCVMPGLFPNVTIASHRLLTRLGYEVVSTGSECCGALHAHSGLNHAPPHFRADLPLIVDSAGCGSHLKSHHDGPVFDISEFLLANGLVDLLKDSPGIDARVTYQDACHLAHAQRIREAPRQLMQAIPHVHWIEMPISDRCCGSAGIYNVNQPGFARELLSRKWADIVQTDAEIVAVGNPGCHAWIEQARREQDSPIRILHTCELLEASFSGP